MARSLLVFPLLPVLLTLLAPSSRGQAGSLDSSFGGDGMVTTDLQGPASVQQGGGFSVLGSVRDDGKTVITSTSMGPDGLPRISVVRVLANGALDPSFDVDGRQTTTLWSADPMTAANPIPTGIAFDGDRTLVVGRGWRLGGAAGMASTFAIRYLDDGALDPSFGASGIALVDVPVFNASGCAVRNGRTYIGTVSSPSSGSSVVCLDQSGALDPAFGVLGVATIPGLVSQAGLSLTSDGRITVIGGSSTNQAVLAARLLPSGALDTSFDLDGIAVVGLNSGALSSGLGARAVACRSDDTTLVCMHRSLGDPTYERRIEVVRLLANGAIDTSFGGGWVQTHDYLYFTAMALEPSGAVLLTGADDQGHFAARRIGSSGAFDAAFGGAGEARVVIADEYVNASAIATHPDGGSVLVGSSWSPSDGSRLAVVRLSNSGSADTDFGGGDGALSIAVEGSASDFGQDVVAMQGDGKIVVLGRSSDSTVLARYEPDGDLDPTFGDQGLVVSQSWPNAAAVAIQTGGRILIACSHQGTQSRMAVVGLTSAGDLDTVFGVGGMAVLDHPSGLASAATALLTLADGGILVAGGLQDPVSWWVNDVVVARLHSNGTPDASFGALGFATFGTPAVNDAVTSIAAFPMSGKIAVGGIAGNFVGLALLDGGGTPLTGFTTSIAYNFSSAFNGVDVAVDATDQLYLAGGLVPEANGEVAVARLLPDRTLDAGFGAAGIAVADFGPSGSLAGTVSLAVQGDGRPVAAGTFGSYSWLGIDGDFAVARWNTDGTLDQSFGDLGRAAADFGHVDNPAAVAIQGDGGIVVAGTTADLRQTPQGWAIPADIAVARFHGVTTPEGLISELVPVVEEFVEEGLLTHGESSSLQKKLEASLQQVDNGKTTAAANQLTAFVNQVNALVNSGRLAPVDGAHLADWATSARDLILGG